MRRGIGDRDAFMSVGTTGFGGCLGHNQADDKCRKWSRISPIPNRTWPSC
jgi:hypothetical protein